MTALPECSQFPLVEMEYTIFLPTFMLTMMNMEFLTWYWMMMSSAQLAQTVVEALAQITHQDHAVLLWMSLLVICIF